MTRFRVLASGCLFAAALSFASTDHAQAEAKLLIDAASGKEIEPGVHVIPFALAVRRSSAPPGG
jgi:hypothetical protein